MTKIEITITRLETTIARHEITITGLAIVIARHEIAIFILRITVLSARIAIPGAESRLSAARLASFLSKLAFFALPESQAVITRRLPTYAIVPETRTNFPCFDGRPTPNPTVRP